MKASKGKLKLLFGAALVAVGALCLAQVQEPKSEAQSCVASGYMVQTCGCWGPVSFGSSYPDLRCCSGWSTPVACFGGCSAGGSPYRVVCN